MKKRHVHLTALAAASGLAVAVVSAAASASAPPESPPPDTGGGASGSIQVLFGSSGDAETTALNDAAARFTEATGIDVEVVPAQDLTQQLTQGFAGGEPPDVFYLSPENVQLFRDSLLPYGDQIADVDDYYPALLDSYTIDDQLYCLPKDFSNLALVVNQDAWEAAGLTEDDVPTTWEELTEVSTALTTDDQAGLVFSGEADRVGAFMVQAGGWYTNDDQTEATADSDEVIAALQYVQDNVAAGNFQFASQVEAGWGGEAFGTGAGAMTIEGPWIVGALNADYPDVNWFAAPLPEGPAGPGTLTFSNCWGVAAEGNTDAAVEFVEFVSTPEEQQAFSTAFGVIPPRASLAEWYATEQPASAPFAASIDSARGVVTLPGYAAVKSDFNAELQALADGATTPEDVAARLQETTEEVIEDQS
jgi:multiple sugar transport system substrate-binding protein